MIARTEVLRTLSMGRRALYTQVGAEKLEWMTMSDERTCPVCGLLDGRAFPVDKLSQGPAHPLCRCTSLPV